MEPVPTESKWLIRSVSFNVPQEILNRGSLNKVSVGMEALGLEEGEHLGVKGVWITTTDPRVKSRLFVPLTSIGSIRYDKA